MGSTRKDIRPPVPAKLKETGGEGGIQTLNGGEFGLDGGEPLDGAEGFRRPFRGGGLDGCDQPSGGRKGGVSGFEESKLKACPRVWEKSTRSKAATLSLKTERR